MRIGIIAGSRLLPIIVAQSIKKKEKGAEIIAVCFKKETKASISKYVDKSYWLQVGHLSHLREVIKKEGLKQWIMAGQINPLRIFKRKDWDKELATLINQTQDFRPHTIFNKIISHLEKEGIEFLNSTFYLKDHLAEEGLLNELGFNDHLKEDINFGLNIIRRFVELDVGQTIVVKNKSTVALESLEGTDRTILRGFRLAKAGCTVLKFSKTNQDLRFDVPVVGISTLKLLKKIAP